MAKRLVIVESPAKAKTIGGFLGSDYDVQASIGHIRDLLPNAKGLPDDVKKKWWADYAVDVDNDFEPYYEVPPEKMAQVRKLREALKGKDELVLATDEDREGEAISWHLLEVLKPGKKVDVKRIAFHEITKEAIKAALNNPRPVDMNLVEAQEARRILDRLYGYTLSPVLWSRVTKNLSAGRVQSPAVKLIVDREILRRNFRGASYWDLKAILQAGDGAFPAMLKAVDGVTVANGSDFNDATGALKPERAGKVILLDRKQAEELAASARVAEPWNVSRLETKEGVERPAPPFMTTTLQQDANRKFGYGADRTMRIAQSLYEGVAIGGETVGLITYMRTDSLTLSESALDSIRGLIRKDYPDCLPDKAQTYTSKVRNAQEAHEAIRPTDANRRPSSVAQYLNSDQLKIYTLIWQRTVASQMKPAKVLKTEVDVEVQAVKTLRFGASGKQILFDGFLRLYSEGRDEEQDGNERTLPRMELGQQVSRLSVDANGHETKPPARYTEATLIKKLEEQGIGRPSTYASIISVIVDRDYVRKVGKQLVPTFKAFLAMEVLEVNFSEVMDLGFTARMDEVLDDIADGSRPSREYLTEFFLGIDDKPGLKSMVDARKKEIPYPVFLVGTHPESGELIIVRNGKDGSAFLQVGEGDAKRYANVPDDLAPGDLTLEKALELFAQKSEGAASVGTDPATGRKLLLKNRQGYYLEVERTPEEIEAKLKPTWVSVPPGLDPRTFPQEDLDYLCSLPREIGVHPESGETIFFKLGKFGAYVEAGLERRTVEDWRLGAKLDVPAALAILAQPKFGMKRTAAAPIKEFGQLEGCVAPVKVLSGRFGPYVSDGETHATLPKNLLPHDVTEEQAAELLAAKRLANLNAPPKTKTTRGRRPAAKITTKAAAKPATKTGTKTTAKKTTKTVAKKKPPKSSK
ncbi:MAG: type I DNA topoisomerase [Fimbriimonas sp.]